MGHSRLQQKKKVDTEKKREKILCVSKSVLCAPQGRRETRTALTERLKDLHVDIAGADTQPAPARL